MKNELAMRLFSRRPLTEPAAREQIMALSDFREGLMRPDKCSEFEPIRTSFDPANITKPVRWLSKTGGEFLYQKGRPIYVQGVMWNLSRPPTARFPAGPFTNYWTGTFDGKWAVRVGIEKVEDFLSTMFRVTGSDFGFLTSEVDLEAKNTNATSLSYKGMDLASGIPGLYWVNFLSDELAAWLGIGDFPERLAALKRLTGGGVSLKFCNSPDECRSFEVLQKQRAAIEWLGPQRFFDIRFPERKQDVPNWDSLPLRTSGTDEPQ
jgi:hypothetical protein